MICNCYNEKGWKTISIYYHLIKVSIQSVERQTMREEIIFFIQGREGNYEDFKKTMVKK